MLGAILLLLALTNAVHTKGKSSDLCEAELVPDPRPHSVSITEFGAVGDGKADNTLAFQNAVFYLKSFADKGGAQLYVPAGRWLTGSFNLTSHLTLFLGKGAVIFGSQDLAHWETVDPLPSYGRGIDFPGRRYRSLINGYMLQDVVITGDNGTIDGQGSMWWGRFENGSLNYSRPHLIEFMGSDYVIVSNLTLLNPPAYGIHPVYCSDVHIHNVSISAPAKSPHTVGIVPDSSNNVCVQDSVINMGYDSIALKSGWDEYGIAFGRPTTNVCIRRVDLRSYSGSAIAFGSEMSGGISNIRVEHLNIHNSSSGIELRTTRGRGGYIKEITVTDIVIDDVRTAFSATGQCGSHPDDDFDPIALPSVQYITLKNISGTNISVAGKFTGIQESPFTPICLSNIWLSMSHAYSAPWTCSDILGSSSFVFPEPCRELMSPSSCIFSSIGREIGGLITHATQRVIPDLKTKSGKIHSNKGNNKKKDVTNADESPKVKIFLHHLHIQIINFVH